MVCNKLSYSMRETITISVPLETRRKIKRAARRQRVNSSEYVRRALEQQFALDALESARGELVPQARAKGIITDEDVFQQFRS